MTLTVHTYSRRVCTGRVFDTLNMNILQHLVETSDDDDALGMSIIAYNYQGDGIETTYRYSDNKQFTQKVLVYSKTNGYLTNFTINQESGQIIFATPPANGEIFNVTSFGVTGDKMIFDYPIGISATQNTVDIPNVLVKLKIDRC